LFYFRNHDYIIVFVPDFILRLFAVFIAIVYTLVYIYRETLHKVYSM